MESSPSGEEQRILQRFDEIDKSLLQHTTDTSDADFA